MVLDACPLLMLALTAGAPLEASPSPKPPDGLTTELAAISQQLLDAVASGRREVWERHTAPEMVHVDYDGSVSTRAELLEGLTGLPKGYEGQLRVSEPKAMVTGDTAVLTFRALETMNVFGQRIEAVFRVTDTFVRRGGRWLLLAEHSTILPPDPKRVPIEAARLDDYTGTYALAPEQQIVVTREGDRLMGRRGKGAPFELIPIGPDTFFAAGSRGDRLFVRDATGRVSAMIDRRDGRELRWERQQIPSHGPRP